MFEAKKSIPLPFCPQAPTGMYINTPISQSQTKNATRKKTTPNSAPPRSLIWDNVKQSRVVELGGDRADFALKVEIVFFGFWSGQVRWRCARFSSMKWYEMTGLWGFWKRFQDPFGVLCFDILILVFCLFPEEAFNILISNDPMVIFMDSSLVLVEMFWIKVNKVSSLQPLLTDDVNLSCLMGDAQRDFLRNQGKRRWSKHKQTQTVCFITQICWKSIHLFRTSSTSMVAILCQKTQPSYLAIQK